MKGDIQQKNQIWFNSIIGTFPRRFKYLDLFNIAISSDYQSFPFNIQIHYDVCMLDDCHKGSKTWQKELSLQSQKRGFKFQLFLLHFSDCQFSLPEQGDKTWLEMNLYLQRYPVQLLAHRRCSKIVVFFHVITFQLRFTYGVNYIENVAPMAHF